MRFVFEFGRQSPMVGLSICTLLNISTSHTVNSFNSVLVYNPWAVVVPLDRTKRWVSVDETQIHISGKYLPPHILPGKDLEQETLHCPEIRDYS